MNWIQTIIYLYLSYTLCLIGCTYIDIQGIHPMKISIGVTCLLVDIYIIVKFGKIYLDEQKERDRKVYKPLVT